MRRLSNQHADMRRGGLRLAAGAALLGALLGTMAAPSLATAQAAGNDSGSASQAVTPQSAEDFARAAAISGLFEIEASQMALERSADPAVRRFAQAMITDHTEAARQLEATAGSLQLPKELDPVHRERIAALKNAGANFDRIYVEQQIEAHKEAVSLFTRFSTTGPNGSLKGWASQLLPMLQQHQQWAGTLLAR